MWSMQAGLLTAPAWFVTADEVVARLYRVERSVAGLIVRMEDEIHGAPGARRTEANAAPWDCFAAEVAVWLQRMAEDLQLGRVDVFAPPPLLAPLHEAWPAGLAMRIREHAGRLTGKSAAELEADEAISALLGRL